MDIKDQPYTLRAAFSGEVDWYQLYTADVSGGMGPKRAQLNNDSILIINWAQPTTRLENRDAVGRKASDSGYASQNKPA